jgi:hypothetical protein
MLRSRSNDYAALRIKVYWNAAGEHGDATGKAAIHGHGGRRAAPFVGFDVSVVQSHQLMIRCGEVKLAK